MGFSEVKSTQDWTKFDKALAKKGMVPTVITQAKNCRDYSACKNHLSESFGVIPLGNLQIYEGPETKKSTYVQHLTIEQTD